MNDRSELEQQIQDMLTAIEEDHPNGDWKLGNFIVVAEVITPVEGDEDTFTLNVRTRFKGPPTNAIGILRVAEESLLKGVLEGGSEADGAD
jgi:hypothetical protein